MLFRNMHMRSIDGAFKVFPKVFQTVHMAIAANIFLLAVINMLVLISAMLERCVTMMLVGMNRCSLRYVLADNGQQSLSAGVSDNFWS